MRERRGNHETRVFIIERDFQKHPDGSVMISCGDTKVLCSAMIQNSVPPFLDETESGWITAEYNMLPGSSDYRVKRARGKYPGGRVYEIQRLIGRSLRAAVDMSKIPGISVLIDCDVIQADGGTRTTSIIGGFIALGLALQKYKIENDLDEQILNNYIGAISVGIVNGEILVDLDFEEDSQAAVDMNFVMDAGGNFIEIQGTGEKGTMSKDEVYKMTDFAEKAIKTIIEIEKEVFDDVLP